MKKLLAIILLGVAATASAHNCPNDMKAIDAALSSTRLTGPDLDKVKALRADGEKFHKAGKHNESMKALGEAKKLLGI